MHKKIFILMCMAVMLTFTGCTKWELVGEVAATIKSKEHRDSYTTTTLVPIRAGKATIMSPRIRHVSEKNYLVLQYEDSEITIDNKTLYDTKNIGDKINVNYYTSEDRRKIVYSH